MVNLSDKHMIEKITDSIELIKGRYGRSCPKFLTFANIDQNYISKKTPEIQKSVQQILRYHIEVSLDQIKFFEKIPKI